MPASPGSPVAALVEALEAIASPGPRGRQQIARRALAAWRERKPLRDDGELREALWMMAKSMECEPSTVRRGECVAMTLDDIDEWLSHRETNGERYGK